MIWELILETLSMLPPEAKAGLFVLVVILVIGGLISMRVTNVVRRSGTLHLGKGSRNPRSATNSESLKMAFVCIAGFIAIVAILYAWNAGEGNFGLKSYSELQVEEKR